MITLPSRALLALVLTSALAGCASLSPQPRNADITELLAERGGPAVDWSAVAGTDEEAESLERWLSEPMTLDAATRVAMLRSPRLREHYARLGLARAEVLEAVEIENPRLSFQRMSIDGGGHNRTTGLSMPLLDLLLLPAKARLAATDYDRARYDVAGAVLDTVADVEAAWYAYVTARQVAGMREAVSEAAEASAELAGRFHAAGNISALQLAQEQAAASQAYIEALQARADAGRHRLALHTLLGLRGEETNWEASDSLPLPVPAEDDPEQLARLAGDGNLGVLAARAEAEVLADALGLTRKLRWFGGSEIGYEREREADGARLQGPEISLELPIFNQGQAKLARAEARLMEALARVQQAELAADNGVRMGAQTVAALRDVVDIHRQALVPQREAIVARQQERQNFMLIGVFELIQAKVAEYDAYQAYLEAVRDYWLARVELARLVGRRLPSDAGIEARTPSLEEILGPGEAPAMDHSAHGGMDHSTHEDAKPADAEEMDHSMHEGMDHSMHKAAKPAEAEEADHSMHEGMDHSGHDMPADPEPADVPEKSDDEAPSDQHDHHHGAIP
ncbi:copper resistance-related lipoprotein [Arenimonas soli]|uniref:Copper resistance-related lipoprotein n=1 Tax=Arenimonas soli TaxID=2269504 RepID=A0ABQ1HGD3_9GAMM|nr:TolC family protein [Arenimonas soli]GGA74838.1 copper resistance-related lipoprotein [Arenimonas soli]